jgi:hypothetical protein
MSELPDYVLDPDAVLKDISAAWRHGNAPDYSKTRAFYEKSTSLLFLITRILLLTSYS